MPSMIETKSPNMPTLMIKKSSPGGLLPGEIPGILNVCPGCEPIARCPVDSYAASLSQYFTGTPVPIRPFLKEHTVQTTAERGWDTLEKGELLKTAEAAGVNSLVTLDKNIRYQQNLTLRTIALAVLGNPQWPILRLHVERVVAAVNAAGPGSYTEVEIPEP